MVVVLLADVAVVVVTAVAFTLPTAVALGLTAGTCQSLGKLSLDALIQRDVPETVRTSVFARAETLMQLSWVMGGFLGIALPLDPAAEPRASPRRCCSAWTGVVMRGAAAQRRRRRAA